MLITTPIGGFIDATNYKRSWIIVPGIGVVLASVIILFSQDFWAVAASQIATSVAGAAIVPAVTGITLGIVKQKGFNRQNGRNQAFNHAGNMVGAAVSGYLGWRYGYTAVFARTVDQLPTASAAWLKSRFRAPNSFGFFTKGWKRSTIARRKCLLITRLRWCATQVACARWS
jgi:predicted MFS family arabinose efflux permease